MAPPPGAPRPAPSSSSPCSLLDLPDDLLAQIADDALDADIANFWRLSRVSRAAKSLIEVAAGRRCTLGGDASARCLRMRTSLAEPAVPLRRLLSCMHNLEELDLGGAHDWVRGNGHAIAEAIAEAPFAPRLRRLSLDHCDRFGDAAAERLFCQSDMIKLMLRIPLLPRLRELSVRSCRGLKSMLFIDRLPALERLDCAWCAELEAGYFAEIGVSLREVFGPTGWSFLPPLPPLRYLDLSGVQAMHDRCVTALPTTLVELRLVATAISDASLSIIADRLAELRRLVLPRPDGNLWASGSWTDGGLAELRRRRPELKVEVVSV
jgi:hypothetical protein